MPASNISCCFIFFCSSIVSRRDHDITLADKEKKYLFLNDSTHTQREITIATLRLDGHISTASESGLQSPR